MTGRLGGVVASQVAGDQERTTGVAGVRTPGSGADAPDLAHTFAPSAWPSQPAIADPATDGPPTHDTTARTANARARPGSPLGIRT